MLETSLVLASNGASSVSDHLCSKFRSTSGRMTAKYPTGFEEMNGGCLSSERERKENSPEALSNFRAVVFSGSWITLRVASPIAERKPRSFSSGSARWTRIEFHLSECLSKLGQRILNHL